MFKKIFKILWNKSSSPSPSRDTGRKGKCVRDMMERVALRLIFNFQMKYDYCLGFSYK